MDTATPTDPLANALHAAEVFLQRHEIDAGATVVVTIKPAAIGVWLPGLAHVQTWPTIDDVGAELAEAVAPVALRALEELTPDGSQAVLSAMSQGGRLQVLLSPAASDASVRLASATGSVQLAEATLAILQ
jgi:hypothetical protein